MTNFSRRCALRALGGTIVMILLAFGPGTALTAVASASSRSAPGPKQLRPNIVVLPPLDVVLERESTGCDVYERIEEGAQRCLRYDTIVVNNGDGPLELRYRVDSIGRDHQLRQRIFNSDGSFSERVADSFEFHPGHGHMHYANFAVARLWNSNQRGDYLDTDAVRESQKAGFCLYDGENLRSGSKRSVPRRYHPDDACRPNEAGPTEVSQVNGLSVGWMDIYDRGLSDQYIDVSGLPSGYYLLEIEVDPLNTLMESNESDNSISVLIWLPAG